MVICTAARHLLFWAHDLPFDTLIVVWSPTCRAETVHIILDVVVAKLTDLKATDQSSTKQSRA